MTDMSSNVASDLSSNVGDGFSSGYGGDGSDVSDGGVWSSSPMLRAAVYAVAIIAVIVLIYYFVVPRSLTTRLENAGWFLFMSPTCPHCKRQLEVLGGSYSKSTQCSGGKSSNGSPIPCSKISAFPTWYNIKSGETVKGMRSVSQLEEMLAQKK